MHKTPSSTKSGDFLFRWRSYLPLLLILVLLPHLDEHNRIASPLYHAEFETLCLAVSSFGLLIRAMTVGFVPSGTSGRNTKDQIADSLNTTGIYSITRNPLYLGNFFMMLGVVMFCGSWSATLIFILAFWLYYERIIHAEERFLYGKFGEQYTNYIKAVPAFIPNFSLWVKPKMKFSLRTVLRREYSSFFAMIASFYALEFFGDLFSNQSVEFEPLWTILFASSAVLYLTLRTLKKKTRLLDVQGR